MLWVSDSLESVSSLPRLSHLYRRLRPWRPPSRALGGRSTTRAAPTPSAATPPRRARVVGAVLIAAIFLFGITDTSFVLIFHLRRRLCSHPRRLNSRNLLPSCLRTLSYLAFKASLNLL